MIKDLFKNKSFLYLWTSQIMSQLTINIMNFLIIVRVYEYTHSPIASSFIWVAIALPAIIIGPFGAATVDFSDRRKVLVFSNLAQASAVFAFALIYKQYLFLSYGIVFLYSLFNQFYVPAESASIPYLVKKKELTEANSLFFISQQLALIIAFSTAGLVSEFFGYGPAFLLGSVFLLIAAAAIRRLPKMEVGKIPGEKSLRKVASLFITQIIEGFRFILNDKRVLFPFVFLLTLWTMMSILTVNLPAISEELFKLRANLAGLTIILPAGIGALIGTSLVSRYDGIISKKKVVSTALFCLGLVFIVVPLVVPMLNFWAGRAFIVAAFLLAGIGYVGALVPSLTYLQEITPAAMMGRVLGYFWFVSSVIGVIPIIFSATITEIFGIRTLLVLFGLVALFGYYALSHLIPKYLKIYE